MTRLAVVLAALGAWLLPAVAAADDGDAARLSAASARIGEQLTLDVSVVVPGGAMVQVDPGDEAWAALEIVDVQVVSVEPAGASAIHRLTILLAAFEPGEAAITPAVLVLGDDRVERRELPRVHLTVTSTLRPGDPLELSPLPLPESIGGARSPWLVPGVIAGVGATLVLALAAATGAIAVARRWWAARPEPLGPAPAPVPDMAEAESLILRDPVAGYRELARAVRSHLAAEYGFPARALTTEELQQRMHRAGVDSWVARMTRDLLNECDAVVYAGYRPASKRRTGDLRIAREILGVDG